MNTVKFISDCLEQVQLRLLSTCEGLTQEQVLWRPAPYANNIGFILWHVTRAEDNLVSRLINVNYSCRPTTITFAPAPPFRSCRQFRSADGLWLR